MRSDILGILQVIFVLAVLGLVSPEFASAQESINYASLSGLVTDSSGAVIVGASITAVQTATNAATTTVTDGEGRFRFPYLKVGLYAIKVHQQGFADVTRSVTLTVGAAFDLPISLAVESAKETVTVNGEAAAIETTRTQVAGTVIQNEINNLPLNGRSFLDLTLLVPGVSLT